MIGSHCNYSKERSKSDENSQIHRTGNLGGKNPARDARDINTEAPVQGEKKRPPEKGGQVDFWGKRIGKAIDRHSYVIMRRRRPRIDEKKALRQGGRSEGQSGTPSFGVQVSRQLKISERDHGRP